MTLKNKIIILTIFIVLTTQWSLYPHQNYHNYKGNTSKDINIKKLALMLNDSLRKPVLKNKEIGIMTFVNLNNLEKAAPIGRFLQEELSHALFENGFRIIELRIGTQILFVPNTGELNLTRLKDKLKDTKFKGLNSIIAGTYIDAGDYVYVNARLIELETNSIRASGEIKIRKGDYLKKLLQSNPNELNTNPDDVFERFPTPTKDNKE